MTPFSPYGTLCLLKTSCRVSRIAYVRVCSKPAHSPILTSSQGKRSQIFCDFPHTSACVGYKDVLENTRMKGAALEGQQSAAKQQLQQQLHCPYLGRPAALHPRSIRRVNLHRNESRTMAIAAESVVAEKSAPTQRPDRDGRFGRFGGKYVRHTLLRHTGFCVHRSQLTHHPFR